MGCAVICIGPTYKRNDVVAAALMISNIYLWAAVTSSFSESQRSESTSYFDRARQANVSYPR